MTIQDLVPDLSICQEAKDKGVEIESVHYWNNFYGDWEVNDASYYKLSKDCTPAPLTDEILEKLPANFNINENTYYLTIEKIGEIYLVGYKSEDIEVVDLYETEDKKLSNALYLLYMKLKKEGII